PDGARPSLGNDSVRAACWREIARDRTATVMARWLALLPDGVKRKAPSLKLVLPSPLRVNSAARRGSAAAGVKALKAGASSTAASRFCRRTRASADVAETTKRDASAKAAPHVLPDPRIAVISPLICVACWTGATPVAQFCSCSPAESFRHVEMIRQG